MTDRPIIFSAPMVRALLDGRKTQTRRVLNPQPKVFPVDDQGAPCEVGLLHVDGDRLPRVTTGRVITRQEVRYAVCDRLYVREAWRTFTSLETTRPTDLLHVPNGPRRGAGVRYETDGAHLAMSACDERYSDAGHDHDMRAWGRLRPSIHMPRWASRLTLAVSDVRVQRLQEISEEDARAEGVNHNVNGGPNDRTAFCRLWNSLHGADAWDANPWVVALTFTVERRKIDATHPEITP